LTYRWVEHTGELEVELEAPTEEGVFESGFEAMRELLGGEGAAARHGHAGRARPVSIKAPDRAALLAEWLAELAFVAESERLVPVELASLELGEDGLTAVVEARPGHSPHLVKAATYHRLTLEPTAEGWRATVVLDV
jgi:SHS2 domain-containing protein